MNDRQKSICRILSLLRTLCPAGLTAAAGLLLSCQTMAFVPGRIEAVDSVAGWEEQRESLSPVCGELVLVADVPGEEIREQAHQGLIFLCAQHRRKTEREGAKGVLIDAQLRERGFMKDLKMRRSVSLMLTVRTAEKEYLARYICCIEGAGTIESAPRLYRLLERGFGKLFP